MMSSLVINQISDAVLQRVRIVATVHTFTVAKSFTTFLIGNCVAVLSFRTAYPSNSVLIHKINCIS